MVYYFFVVFLQQVTILLTGSRGETRTHDHHRMKVPHLPLCYSTPESILRIRRPSTLTNLLGSTSL